MLDVLFVSPNTSKVYQGLADKYSAIEPPTWSLLLAQSCRAKGYSVAILDCDAERLSPEAAVLQIAYGWKPRLVVFVTYGQNPNSGTTNMTGTLAVASLLKKTAPELKSISVGSHTSALPHEVLDTGAFDYIAINEGVYTIHQLLQTNLDKPSMLELEKISGLGYKLPYSPMNLMNTKINNGRIIPQEMMDTELPGYAWDLLPYKEKPFDLYRSHFWHTNYNHKNRTPFAAIYSSLGCRFKCNFCMINIINRTDPGEGVHAANSSNMRFWSPELIINEFDKLASYGVETIRISDEMFFLDKRYYVPLIDKLIERDYKINTWTYARIDTVQEKHLENFKKAGVNWLALGIEAANQQVRQEITKGKFKDVDIRDIVKTIKDHDINAGLNYIFGFPTETQENMQETLDLAMELQGEFSNFYCATTLPGSPLYYEAKANGWELPDTFEGYGFLAYEHLPSRTHHMTAAEVVKFRDEAWHKYFTNPTYLAMIEKRFGAEQRNNLEAQTKIKLKRKILGD
jgi:anaerobic magnesium-protoporphyrin IX monomethyl ester cyclase